MLFEKSCQYIMAAYVPGTVTVMRNRAGSYMVSVEAVEGTD